MSKWKAGQCITIEGKRYRVTKLHNNMGSCIFCGFRFKECNEYPCVECIDSVRDLIPEDCYIIPEDCYFKEIKPKS